MNGLRKINVVPAIWLLLFIFVLLSNSFAADRGAQGDQDRKNSIYALTGKLNLFFEEELGLGKEKEDSVEKSDKDKKHCFTYVRQASYLPVHTFKTPGGHFVLAFADWKPEIPVYLLNCVFRI